MDSVKELAKQIAGYIKGKKTRAYDTAAEVRRIVGNTAYVHIPGGVPETPVKLTIDAKVGDTVQVRVANSTAWLVGNSTAPPTDDTKAKEADANAGKAMTKAKKAEAIAEEGLKEAQGTSNYFWHIDGSGAESGAHVTEIPQKEFEDNPSGGNLLLKSTAMKIRRGLQDLAAFTSDGMTVYDGYGEERAYFGETIRLGNPLFHHLEISRSVESHSTALMLDKRNSGGEITSMPCYISFYEDGTIILYSTSGGAPYTWLTIQGGSDGISTLSKIKAKNINEVMSATVRYGISLGTSGKKITLQSYAVAGDNLSISNGGIQCAEDGTVLVSAQVYYTSVTNQDVMNIAIHKVTDGGTDTTVASVSTRATGNSGTVLSIAKLITVSDFDTFYLYGANGTSARGNMGSTVTGGSSQPSATEKLRTVMTVQYV